MLHDADLRKKHMFTGLFPHVPNCQMLKSHLTLMVNKHELACEFSFICKASVTIKKVAPADGRLDKEEEEKGGRADRRENRHESHQRHRGNGPISVLLQI